MYTTASAANDSIQQQSAKVEASMLETAKSLFSVGYQSVNPACYD